MDLVSQCKHGLRTGCAFCHAGAVAPGLNDGVSKARVVGRRESRAFRYAAKLETLMRAEGAVYAPWAPSKQRPLRSHDMPMRDHNGIC